MKKALAIQYLSLAGASLYIFLSRLAPLKNGTQSTHLDIAQEVLARGEYEVLFLLFFLPLWLFTYGLVGSFVCFWRSLDWLVISGCAISMGLGLFSMLLTNSILFLVLGVLYGVVVYQQYFASPRSPQSSEIE